MRGFVLVTGVSVLFFGGWNSSSDQETRLAQLEVERVEPESGPIDVATVQPARQEPNANLVVDPDAVIERLLFLIAKQRHQTKRFVAQSEGLLRRYADRETSPEEAAALISVMLDLAVEARRKFDESDEQSKKEILELLSTKWRIPPPSLSLSSSGLLQESQSELSPASSTTPSRPQPSEAP